MLSWGSKGQDVGSWRGGWDPLWEGGFLPWPAEDFLPGGDNAGKGIWGQSAGSPGQGLRGGGIEQGPQPKTRLPWTESSRNNTTCPRCRCEIGSVHSYCCPQVSRGLPLPPPWGPPRLLPHPFLLSPCCPPTPVVCLFLLPLLSLFPKLHLCPEPSSSVQPTYPQGGGPDHPPTPGHGVLLSALLPRCEPECEDAPITYTDRAQIWELGVGTVGEAGPRELVTPCKGPQLPGQQEVGSEPGKRPIHQASWVKGPASREGPTPPGWGGPKLGVHLPVWPFPAPGQGGWDQGRWTEFTHTDPCLLRPQSLSLSLPLLFPAPQSLRFSP